MFPGTIARNYARGLLQAAARQDLPALQAGLHEFVRALGAHRDLGTALRHRALPVPRKLEIVKDALGAAGAPPLLIGFVQVVVGNGHVGGLAAIDQAFARAVAGALGITRADVRFAHPASEEEIRKIAEALGRAVGRTVEVHATVDPTLIGGFVAQAGSLVFDGSVARQIERMRGELVRG